MLDYDFFNRDAKTVAKALLGKVIVHRVNGLDLAAQVIETEAYYKREKASHAALGFTEKRKALFMPAGTIYMYYARGGDSLNVSCKGAGNAVLIKSAMPYKNIGENALKQMQRNNPNVQGSMRTLHKLCKGQTLLCKALSLRVPDWDGQQFVAGQFYIYAADKKQVKIIRCRRLGIPEGRDGHLLYRFVDLDNAHLCTENPLTKRTWVEGQDYFLS